MSKNPKSQLADRRTVLELEDRVTVLEQWTRKLSQEVDELRKALAATDALPATPQWDMTNQVSRERWDSFCAQHNEQDINNAIKALNFVWNKWEQANVFCKHVVIHESDIPPYVIKGASWTFQRLVETILPRFTLTYDSERKRYVMYEDKVS